VGKEEVVVEVEAMDLEVQGVVGAEAMDLGVQVVVGAMD
jgi:hypothetical protein